MKTAYKIWISIAIVILLICGFLVLTYNSLASQNNNVESSWSQVENVMQRRADLIPNLTNTVKGSMKQEQKVFGDLAKAREHYNNASTADQKDAANSLIDKQLGIAVNIINERYPELKSNDNVKSLMVQLEGSENRISTERREYIRTVNDYNNSLVRFPRNLVAHIFGFHKKTQFKAQEGANKTPSINFDNTTK